MHSGRMQMLMDRTAIALSTVFIVMLPTLTTTSARNYSLCVPPRLPLRSSALKKILFRCQQIYRETHSQD
ncbi:hypothetical protein [Chlorogloeopsis sp. ULAP02]|uniref:hypothetical protein n=1 Tax=Chlorogloeopsis sp. ULAP02 TaxID=3107926 RepID=UPI00313665EC